MPPPRFASFTRRLLAVGVDILLAFLVANALHDVILRHAGGLNLERRDLALLLLLIYFAACWRSRLQGTPVQRLLRLRVIGQGGGTLSGARSLARSALLVTLIAGALCLFRMPAEPVLGPVALVSLLLVATAAVTRCRQGSHDLLVRSVVVKGAALEFPAQREALRSVVEDRGPGAWRRGRPSWVSMAADLILLAMLTALLHGLATEHLRRDRLFRVNYALNGTTGLQESVVAFYRATGRMPDHGGDLGLPARTAYPDGGYYELIEGGLIRIRFSTTPELVGGAILLVPLSGSGGFQWLCEVDGRIAPAFLPRRCRAGLAGAGGGRQPAPPGGDGWQSVGPGGSQG